MSHQILNRITYVLPILVLLLVAGLTVGNTAETTAQEPTPSPAQEEEREALSEAERALYAAAETWGKARVIVLLNVPTQPESLLSTAAQRQQRDRIQQMQEDVLHRLDQLDQLDQLNQEGQENQSAGLQSKSYRLNARYEVIPGLALSVDTEALDLLLQDPDIAAVGEDELHRPTLSQSIPHIGVDKVWQSGITGKGQAVAILDTGVDKTHPFLKGKIISEACYSSNDPDYGISSVCPGGVTESTAAGAGMPCAVEGCNHGTHVAGIAAGTSDSFSGVAKEANIIAIQVFARVENADLCGDEDPCSLASTSDILKGLERVYGIRNNYTIASANMSLGGGLYDSVCDTTAAGLQYYPIAENLKKSGIATIAASGNNYSKDSMSSPACVSNIISVGSASNNDVVSGFSNSISFLDLLAPGEQIYSSIPGGGFDTMGGTSMATPHVAGIWALAHQKDPTISVEDVLNGLKETGVMVTDSENGVTTARVQVDAFIESIGGILPPSAPNPPTNLTLTALSERSVGVSWSDQSDNETGFRVERSIGDGNWQQINLPADTTSYQDTILSCETLYYYRVQAFNDGGESAFAGPETIMTGSCAQPATIIGSVTLQGRPEKPDASWVVPLNVVVTQPNSTLALYTYTPTTDENGTFSVGTIDTGNYDVYVKAANTLEAKRSISLQEGENTVDFGILSAGDVNSDGKISYTDYTSLVASYATKSGDEHYDVNADVNDDLQVSLVDFSLISSNYEISGTMSHVAADQPAHTTQTGSVEMQLEPSATTVGVEEPVDVTIKLVASSIFQLIDSSSAFLAFDPQIFEVESITPNTALERRLAESYDNEQGWVHIARGTLGFPQIPTTLATVHFRTKAAKDGTKIKLSTTRLSPATSNIAVDGSEVLSGSLDTAVDVQEQGILRFTPKATTWAREAGEPVTYTLELINTSTLSTTLVNLRLYDSTWPTSMQVESYPQSVYSDTTVVNMLPGQREQIELRTHVPDYAQAGTSYLATLEAEPQEHTESMALATFHIAVLDLDLDEPETVAVSEPAQRVNAGEVAKHSITITNTGSSNEQFVVDVVESRWLTTLSGISLTGEAGNSLSQTVVGPLTPGDHATVTVQVDVPSTAKHYEQDVATVQVALRRIPDEQTTLSLSTVNGSSTDTELFLPLVQR